MGIFYESVFSLVVLVFCVSFTVSTGATTTASTSAENKSKQVDKQTTEIINDDKAREVYIKCLLDKGPCSNEAADVKKLLPEAVQKGCGKCSEMHKKIIEKMMLHLQQKQSDILKEVTAKFDPKGEFMKTFLEKLTKDAANKSKEDQKNGEKEKMSQNDQKQKSIRN